MLALLFSLSFFLSFFFLLSSWIFSLAFHAPLSTLALSSPPLFILPFHSLFASMLTIWILFPFFSFLLLDCCPFSVYINENIKSVARFILSFVLHFITRHYRHKILIVVHSRAFFQKDVVSNFFSEFLPTDFPSPLLIRENFHLRRSHNSLFPWQF